MYVKRRDAPLSAPLSPLSFFYVFSFARLAKDKVNSYDLLVVVNYYWSGEKVLKKKKKKT